MDKLNRMLAGFEPMALSLFRIVTGLLLFQYGVAKILKFPVLPYFANIPPLITVAGDHRTDRRRIADPRAVHAAGGIHPVRPDGVRLFHGTHVQGRDTRCSSRS